MLEINIGIIRNIHITGKVYKNIFTSTYRGGRWGWEEGALQTISLCPCLLALLAPLRVKNFWGRFLASILAQVWRDITENTKNADFKKTGPPSCPPITCTPGPLGESKKSWNIFGIYLRSSLKKYHQKYQECRFLKNWHPSCPPWLLSPLVPLGVRKFFGRFLASI